MIRTGPDNPNPRVKLPGGRAVTGGLLVTVAAVGIFAAYSGSGGDGARSYIVASHDIAEGRRISSEDLTYRRGPLDDGLASRSFSSTDDLTGMIAVAPMRADDLIQLGDVVSGSDPGTAPAREFSFAIEADHAVDGTLRRGETIDVLATYGSGSDAYTAVVSTNTKLTAVSAAGQQTIGSNTKLVLTVAIDSPTELVELAHATQTGAITVVRSTGIDSQLTRSTFTPAPTLAPPTKGLARQAAP